MYDKYPGGASGAQFAAAEPRSPSVGHEMNNLHEVSDTIMTQLQDLQNRLQSVLRAQPLTGIAGGKETKDAASCGCELADHINGATKKLGCISEMISQLYARLEI